MINIVPFTILFGVMALAAALLGRYFPECMFQRPVKWLLYGLSAVIVGVMIFTWIMALNSRA